MNTDFSCLRDPETGAELSRQGDILVGGSRPYPIVDEIPRFLSDGNYADDFGDQWNKFPRTQLDSYTGINLTESRLDRCFHGQLSQIRGKRVLEAGSGAGRFTEVLLKNGAILDSFDLSSAVTANRSNNSSSDNLTLVQASIYDIPFQPEAYDYVVCLGVIQHTPSPEESIRNLWRMVKPGGYLVIDHYLFRWRNILPPPIGGASLLYRSVLLKMPRERRYETVRRIVDFWFPIHWKYRDSITIQRILRRLSPVHFYYPGIPLGSEQAFYEWALLDTHDGTTDYYKHHRSAKQIRKLLATLGAQQVVTSEGGNGVEAFCQKPSAEPKNPDTGS
jgi:SAM-dependent methyltransferase